MLSRERGLRMRLRVRVSIARALFLYRKTSKRRCMKLKFLPAAAFNNYYLWGDRQQIFCFVVFAFAAR
jgi:ribosomal protein S18 acetylase RimI-like enzyme